MDPSKRILDQLEQGRGNVRPLAARPQRHYFVYACGVVGAVAVLTTGVVGWGTDSAPRPAPVRDPVFRVAAAPAVGSEQEAERLAAAIVNEPLQQHVLAQGRQPERMASAAATTVALAPRVRAARVTAPSVQPAPPRTPAGPAADDSDVALLAALMAHASGSDAGEHSASPAAWQLRRCARLGGQQAAQCQARACAGHWGRSSACRITIAE